MAGATRVDFGGVFEVTPTPSLVMDTDLMIVAVNAAYLHATARTRTDLLGRYMFDAFPDNPDDPDALATTNLGESLHRVLRTARPDTMPLQKYDVPAADGGFLRRWWSPVNVPVLDETGGSGGCCTGWRTSPATSTSIWALTPPPSPRRPQQPR